jgi:DtxR family Mn-dependent transcriptional regulator
MSRHKIFMKKDMVDKKLLTESEEMYLVTIRKKLDDCHDAYIPIPDIAMDLGVQPVSVNQMVKKLVKSDLVQYRPYKGVELTLEGQRISSRILRHRRLWEVFLVRELKMAVETADDLACHMEHITSDEVGERLAVFLDHPRVNLHGKIIPEMDGSETKSFSVFPLTEFQAGDGGLVARIESDEPTAEFLASEGIQPGMRINVLAVGSNGEVLADSPKGRVQLSDELASRICLEKSV